MNTKVCICIPTLKRFKFLRVNVPKFLDFACVDQVVISDQSGDDIKDIRSQCPEWASHPKLVLFHNTDGLRGAYSNKMECVMQARPGWIALIDSDNSVTETDYFDPWLKYIAANGLDQNKIYLPGSVCSPEIDRVMRFQQFSQIDKTNIASAMHVGNGTWAMCLVNNGNYIVHSQLYQRRYSIDALYDMVRAHPSLALDAAVHVVGLISSGAVIQIVSDMSYYHAVHPESLATVESNNNREQFDKELAQIKRICERIQTAFRDLARLQRKKWTPTPVPRAPKDLNVLFRA